MIEFCSYPDCRAYWLTPIAVVLSWDGFCPSSGDLAMSGDITGCVSSGSASSFHWVEARDAVQSVPHGTDLSAKNYLGPTSQ